MTQNVCSGILMMLHHYKHRKIDTHCWDPLQHVLHRMLLDRTKSMVKGTTHIFKGVRI